MVSLVALPSPLHPPHQIMQINLTSTLLICLFSMVVQWEEVSRGPFQNAIFLSRVLSARSLLLEASMAYQLYRLENLSLLHLWWMWATFLSSPATLKDRLCSGCQWCHMFSPCQGWCVEKARDLFYISPHELVMSQIRKALCFSVCLGSLPSNPLGIQTFGRHLSCRENGLHPDCTLEDSVPVTKPACFYLHLLYSNNQFGSFFKDKNLSRSSFPCWIFV